MSDHPVLDFISPATWALVGGLSNEYGGVFDSCLQIEPLISSRAKGLLSSLIAFLQNDVLPSEKLFHSQIPLSAEDRWKSIPPVLEDLKLKAKSAGLWNLWLSGGDFQGLAGGEGGGLTNLEYAVMAEIMGHSAILAPQATNCSAPDTGNMEVLARFGTAEQKKKYLVPLLNGEIRSSFSMTEYGVASSDATNLKNTSARQEGEELVLNGHKWWITGAGDPRNVLHIVLAVTDPSNSSPHKRHSLVLVDPKAKGVKIVRPLTVFGYDDAPEGHCEVKYDNVRVPVQDVVGGKQGLGRGFEIIQARLGPGRIHHCMRSIGIASRALDLLLERVSDPARKTFGKQLKEHGTVLADIAHSRAEIDQARLLVLAAARQIDLHGAKKAMKDIGIAKFTVPTMALRVVDRAMQVYGAEGVSADTPLAYYYASLRTLRYADGPDEVHVQQIGRQELKRVEKLIERHDEVKKREAKLMPTTPTPPGRKSPLSTPARAKGTWSTTQKSRLFAHVLAHGEKEWHTAVPGKTAKQSQEQWKRAGSVSEAKRAGSGRARGSPRPVSCASAQRRAPCSVLTIPAWAQDTLTLSFFKLSVTSSQSDQNAYHPHETQIRSTDDPHERQGRHLVCHSEEPPLRPCGREWRKALGHGGAGKDCTAESGAVEVSGCAGGVGATGNAETDGQEDTVAVDSKDMRVQYLRKPIAMGGRAGQTAGPDTT
ncbi:acyl-CoA dehydrogenase, partial [Tremellales sp. Uapishka_1]